MINACMRRISRCAHRRQKKRASGKTDALKEEREKALSILLLQKRWD